MSQLGKSSGVDGKTLSTMEDDIFLIISSAGMEAEDDEDKGQQEREC